MELNKIKIIVQSFFNDSRVLKIYKIEAGLINKTYLVEHILHGVRSKFILQCISKIFESHEIVNMNHKLITDHIKKKIKSKDLRLDSKRWEIPNLIMCDANNLFVFPFDSESWRAMEYIDDTFSLDILEDKRMAYQTGIGLSRFHNICSDISYSKLRNSIKNFHDIEYYLKQYSANLNDFDFSELNDEVKKRLENLILNLSNHIAFVPSILRSINERKINFSVIHGDPKLNNFLFDNKYKYVVSLIDLDTVSSGYLLTDLADCIRSICNLAGGDPEDINDVYFDIDYCKHFLRGYFSILSQKGNHGFGSLPEFIYLIIVELTIRFLNDFLQSNKYFKIKYQTHNLYRAEVQYRMLSSFVTQITVFSNSLNEIGFSSNQTFVSDVQKIV